MIKIIAKVDKKIPIAGREFSNNNASITLEAEGNGSNLDAQISDLFRTAESSVDKQLHLQATGQVVEDTPPRQQRPYSSNRNSPPRATEKQISLIKQRAGNRLVDYMDFYKTDIDSIDVKTASAVIDDLLGKNK